MSAPGWSRAAGAALAARPPRGLSVSVEDRRALLRLTAFVPLALFGLVGWGGLVEPPATGPAWGTVLAAGAAACVLLGLRDVADRWVRAAAVTALVLALVVIAFREAGVPAALLWPTRWDELWSGASQGIDGMPSVTVPYRGADAWIRTTTLGGGTLLAGLAALLAFWPRRDRRLGWPLAAAVALSALYAIPVVEHGPGRPFLGGAAFAVLLAAFLWLERLRGEHVGAAALCLTLATAVGLAAAPLLDGERPWLDYQGLAEDLQPRAADTFDWDHRYTPLDWPRDGREVLRIKAPISTYWKATSLGLFDGVRWRQGRTGFLQQEETEAARLHPEWLQTLTVTLRNLESHDFITAGSALRILPPAPDAVRSDADTFVAQHGSLQRGLTYKAQVYSPKPSPIDLASAGAHYPDFALRHYLRMQLPQSVVRVPIHDIGAIKQFPNQELTLSFPAFADQPSPVAVNYGSGAPDQQGGYYLRRSGYARVWRLAQELRAKSSSPYQYITKVLQRVQQGATYSEAPARHRLPLVSFLFGDRAGYCQQFSGAMALLLRMGGVPARVAAGFTPGRYDHRRREYVVRDLDAHSWVEAYFPALGWVTFDPTPAASPASSQADDPANAPVPSLGQVTPNGDRAADPGGSGTRAADQGGSGTAVLVGLALAAAAALIGGGWTLVRRGRLPGPPPAPELFDLQRALHRSGRTPPARTTLRRLEESLGGSAPARDYLRAVRAARYAGTAGGPTPAQRRALRAELAAGLGFRGRVRALWALPPRLPGPRGDRG